MYQVINTSNVAATIFNERLSFDSNTTVTTINEPSREIKCYNCYQKCNCCCNRCCCFRQSIFCCKQKNYVKPIILFCVVYKKSKRLTFAFYCSGGRL